MFAGLPLAETALLKQLKRVADALEEIRDELRKARSINIRTRRKP